MRKYFVFMLFLSFSLLFAQEGKPKINVPEQFFDFGDIQEGEIVSHDFEIQNTGDAELQITRVKASCGCTAAHPDKDVLKPGESTKVKVEFNSASRAGKQRKHVYVFSNDPEQPQMRLSFATYIKTAKDNPDPNAPKINFSTNQYNFGTVKEGEVVSGSIKFANVGGGDLTVLDIKSSCGCAVADIVNKNIAPGETSELKFDFDTKGRTGKLTRTITVITNDPTVPQQVVTLYINITPREA